ncbi:helix-turn-helix domain-containing protein [Gemella morbillorum]
MDKKKIDKKAVGKRIRHIRFYKSLTLEEFGKVIKASKSSISEWEKGKNIPNKKRLGEIAKIVNITANELLYGSYEKDVEELYEGIIRLPKDEIINLMEKVAEYFKQEGDQ